MQIKVSRHVDTSGKIYLPYLHEWAYPNSDLIGLIQVIWTPGVEHSQGPPWRTQGPGVCILVSYYPSYLPVKSPPPTPHVISYFWCLNFEPLSSHFKNVLNDQLKSFPNLNSILIQNFKKNTIKKWFYIRTKIQEFFPSK